MTTQTKEEALALLKRTRREAIQTARRVARELIIERSVPVCVQDVRDEMQRRGIFPGHLDQRWLGAVFPGAGQEFTKSGNFREIRQPDTKHHDGGLWPYWTCDAGDRM